MTATTSIRGRSTGFTSGEVFSPLQRTKRVWQYRRILRLLIGRDLKVRYANSLLGYVWSVLDILLITAAVGFTGGGGSEMYLLYFLTTLFFGAAYPTRSQVVLLGLTFTCYLSLVAVTGWHASGASIFLRCASLGVSAFLVSYLAAELMRHIGFTVSVDVETGDTSRLNVVADPDGHEALGSLIGRKGERLSALQHLVNLMPHRRTILEIEGGEGTDLDAARPLRRGHPLVPLGALLDVIGERHDVGAGQ